MSVFALQLSFSSFVKGKKECNIFIPVLGSQTAVSLKKVISSVFSSEIKPSHLIELDLTGNDPGQSGVKQLHDLLQDPDYQLKTLR